MVEFGKQGTIGRSEIYIPQIQPVVGKVLNEAIEFFVLYQCFGIFPQTGDFWLIGGSVRVMNAPRQEEPDSILDSSVRKLAFFFMEKKKAR